MPPNALNWGSHRKKTSRQSFPLETESRGGSRGDSKTGGAIPSFGNRSEDPQRFRVPRKAGLNGKSGGKPRVEIMLSGRLRTAGARGEGGPVLNGGDARSGVRES